MNRLLWITAAVAALASSSSCTTAASTAESSATTAPAARAQEVTNRFYPADPNEDLYFTYWEEFSDFALMAEEADIVFYGQLAGIVNDVGVEAVAPEEPDQNISVQIFDGLRFKVLEVWKGTPPLSSDRMVVIGHPIGFGTDGVVADPIQVPPIEVFIDALRDSGNRGNGQRFVVYARSYTYADGSQGYVFMGPGSVGAVARDNIHLVESSDPFINLSKEITLYDTDVTVDVVREWIASGTPPEASIPEELWPKAEDAPEQPAPELVVPPSDTEE